MAESGGPTAGESPFALADVAGDPAISMACRPSRVGPCGSRRWLIIRSIGSSIWRRWSVGTRRQTTQRPSATEGALQRLDAADVEFESLTVEVEVTPFEAAGDGWWWNRVPADEGARRYLER